MPRYSKPASAKISGLPSLVYAPAATLKAYTKRLVDTRIWEPSGETATPRMAVTVSYSVDVHSPVTPLRRNSFRPVFVPTATKLSAAMSKSLQTSPATPENSAVPRPPGTSARGNVSSRYIAD